MADDLFAEQNLGDASPATKAETIDLSEFEDGLGADDGSDMGMSDQQQQIASGENSGASDYQDEEFDQMEDENQGLSLEEDEYKSFESNSFSKNEDSEEEEENEDQQQDNLSIEQINKQLGTNFKTLDDLKTFQDQKQNTPVVSEKDQQTYDKNKNAIDYLNSVLSYDDEKLIRTQETSLAIQRNQGKELNEDQKQEIELKIERFKDNGTESLVAQNIRNQVEKTISSRKNFNEKIDEKKQQAKSQEVAQNRQELQQNFKNFFKEGKFMGVELTQKDIQDSYQSVISGNFSKQLNSDHQLTAKLALMSHLYDKIEKRLSPGSFDDGVKAVMKEVDGQPRSQNNRKKTRQVSARNPRGKVAAVTGDPLADAFIS